VESLVRDLVDAGISLVRGEREDEVWPQAEQGAIERLIDLLLPPLDRDAEGAPLVPTDPELAARQQRSRDKLKQQLADGQLEEREVEIEVTPQSYPDPDAFRPPEGMESPDFSVGEWLRDNLPKRARRRQLKVREARRLLEDEELRRLVDMDEVIGEALDRVENHGIVF